MKKITFFLASFFATALMTMSAQQILSHSIDPDTNEGGGVACATNPDMIPQTGDEGISDNTFIRVYNPADFGFSGDFEVQGVRFFTEVTDGGGTNPTIISTAIAFTSDGVAPAGTFTELTSEAFTATVADDGLERTVMFSTPVTVPADTDIIIAIDVSASPAVPDNYDFRIGTNEAGQNSPSYLIAEACGATSPVTFESLGFPVNHLILDLVGTGLLNTSDIDLSQVLIFPNPATNVLNIKVPASVEINTVALYDILGKKVSSTVSNGQVNVADLSRGVYMLSVETTAGTLTEKVIIE